MRSPTRKTPWAQALALALAASLVASPALARSRKGHGRHHGGHHGQEWHHGRGRHVHHAGWHARPFHHVDRHHHHHDDDVDDVLLALGLGAVGLTALALFAQPQASAYGPYRGAAPAAPAAPPIDWSQIDAGVTVVDEGYGESGEFCREFQQEIVVGGRVERGHGIACLQEDGSWRIRR
jgi:hypothetical protein